ncbi:MAG TPA: exodeoxyribonuclease VII large subunit [Coxiellaceae bacterium]|nr:exodeoxyribonuclease VII large subunit [Coxiellaceae bacterium]
MFYSGGMQIETEIQLTEEIFTEILSVSELNRHVRLLLEESIDTVWIEGEISNLSQPSSGHVYFSLKDEDAQIRCALFRGARMKIPHELENGLSVLVRAKVSLYEPRGDYQLIISHLEPAGLGKLQREFELLKQKLEKEGLFDTDHKQPLPEFPRCIGVITSPTGAAIHDILHILKRRFASIPVIIYPTLVQGETAAHQIAHRITIANQREECDVLIVGRGGGSLEDLWPFNEEIVARAIFNSEIPIVSAVGHEVDFTIADFVADVRAPTPSAAAELVSPDAKTWQTEMNTIREHLLHRMNTQLEHVHIQLNSLMKRLRHPGERIKEQMQRLDLIEQRFLFSIQTILKHTHQQLAKAVATLQAYSPLKTLERGYSILMKKESIVHSIQHVKKGDQLQAQLQDGNITCRVE